MKSWKSGVACLAITAFTALAGDPALEKRLWSKEPGVGIAAAREALKEPDRVKSLDLLGVAARLFEAGEKDQAVFWLHAGQLRARYDPVFRDPEKAQLITIFTMAEGPKINSHGMRDVRAMGVTLDKVLAWDERTFRAWALANKLDPEDKELRGRRAQARAAQLEFGRILLANRADYERRARQSPEEALEEEFKGMDKEVARDYSTRIVVRKVGGKALRLPANYLAPTGARFPDVEEVREGAELQVKVFLPEMSGYTPRNWRDVKRMPDLMLVGLRSASHRYWLDAIDTFIASGPPRQQARGMEAYYHDAEKTKAEIPVRTARNHVFVAERSDGNRAYLVCRVDRKEGCSLFAHARAAGIRVEAHIPESHVPRWREIDAKFDHLLKEWLGPP